MNIIYKKYKYPSKISNLNCCYSNKEVKEITQKPEEQYGFYEYRTLFTISRCLGKYEEIIYFLPKAFLHLREKPGDALEFCSNIIYFVSTEIEKIRNDNFVDYIVSELIECLTTWSASFQIIHFNEDDCNKKGWKIKYDDIVVKSQLIIEFINHLLDYKTFSYIAENFIESLGKQTNNPTRSAWYLEISKELRESYGSEIFQRLTESGIDMFPTKRNSIIFNLIMDSDNLIEHYFRINNIIVPNSKSPTYWKDLCNILQIERA